MAAGLTFLSSCKEEAAKLIPATIPDFAALSSQFNQPSKDFTTSPFFVWNAEITKDEILKFLTDFKNAGSSQVFVHPRPGLITEYLSTDWLDLYKYTVEKGKALGMNVWIYDENSYPSGFAGGHVPAEMPESYNQGQGLIMTKFQTLPDTCEKYFICLKEENGSFNDITSSLETEKGKTGNYLLFSKTFNGKSDWYGGFSYVDLLYPGVTEKFIKTTMTGYENSFGAEFGKTVPGTFTDEPQIDAPEGIRWTPDLFDRFKERWHYDLKTQLPSLFEELGDWKKVRHDYYQTLLQLFIDRWAKPWYAYCEEKGLKFTGHYWEHTWPDMSHGGDNMAMYAWHHVPAVDMLFNQFDDSTSRAQFGNVRAIKELASAANQTGRERTLSETYGGSGWDLSFTDMKRNGDWEYALGVNFMNQHLTYFTMAGARKYDYPPSFDYHEPWWNNYKYINDHYARLSLALSAGRQVNDILVLEPSTTAWMYDSYMKPNIKRNKIGQSFQSFVTTLEKAQVEYDLGSETIIRDMGDVSKGKFIVGKCAYSTVIIPPLTENLELETYKLLEKFVTNGGTVLAFSTPSLVDGTVSEGLNEFLSKKGDKIINVSELTNEVISKYLAGKNISFESKPGGTLYHHRRILADGEVLFLVNSSLTEKARGNISVKGMDVIELNTLSGKIDGYKNQTIGDKVSFSYSLPPAGSLLLFIPDTNKSDYTIPAEPATMNPVLSVSPVTVTRDSENALAIDFCDLELGNEVTKDLHTYYAADKVYKFYGFKNGNPWNSSVQYRTNIVDRDTFGVKTGFTATYHFNIKGKFDFTGLKAVVERTNLWSISVNGIGVNQEEGKWWLDRSFGVFDIAKLVKPGDNTITLKASPMKIHAEVEPVYITGDFLVKPAAKGWIIEAPASEYKSGSWKSQGLPFYSWGMTYSKEFVAENSDGTWKVELGSWNGTVAEVSVNGATPVVIAFPPYNADLTGMIKPGKNIIKVKVTGSLKNLMGPHYNNQRPGFVSPGSWRNVKSYPSGNNYQMVDYGLFEDFVLYNGK